MINRIALLLALPALVSAEDLDRSSVLRFGNQDQLAGSLQSLDGQQVVWDSPIQIKPSAFWLREVLDMTLPAEIPIYKASHEATLILARGDSVRGEVAAVTDDWIELQTWFAGRLRFPRSMVREVKIADRPAIVFRGPASLDGWTQSAEPPSWKFQNGAFRSTAAGSIGRNVELPDEFRFAFDASWRGSFNASVIFFSDDISIEKPDHGYELAFMRRSVKLQRCGEHTPLGLSQNAPELQEDEKARLEIRASARTKMICLFVNDRLVEAWTDAGMKRETLGRGIQFMTQGNESVKISGIEVSSWDGVLDETPPERAANRLRDMEAFGGAKADEDGEAKIEAAAKVDEGRMMFRNGDSIAGAVKAITDGIITLKTSYDEVKFPISRLRNITLKAASLEEPKRMKGDVRAWFSDGSSLVFRLDQVTKERITGYSQNFGQADFSLKAFSRIEFNIYDRKLEQLRDQDGW